MEGESATWFWNESANESDSDTDEEGDEEEDEVDENENENENENESHLDVDEPRAERAVIQEVQKRDITWNVMKKSNVGSGIRGTGLKNI